MAQFARPNNDDSIGSWQNDSGGTSNIYQAIDETTASDSDYVRSENDPSTSAYIAGLSTGITDPAVSTGHVVRYRYRKNESGGGAPGQIDLVIQLRQGTTVIASNSHSDVGTSFTDGSFTLTGTETDNITDYTDLNIRVTADKSSGSRTSWGEFSFMELEVPDAASGDIDGDIIGTSSTSGTISKVLPANYVIHEFFEDWLGNADPNNKPVDSDLAVDWTLNGNDANNYFEDIGNSAKVWANNSTTLYIEKASAITAGKDYYFEIRLGTRTTGNVRLRLTGGAVNNDVIIANASDTTFTAIANSDDHTSIRVNRGTTVELEIEHIIVKEIMVGSATGTSSASGTLSEASGGPSPISGDIVGTSSVGTPILKGTGSIDGDAVGTSSVGTPTLKATGSISGDIVGTSTVGTPTLKATGSISGDSVGTSSVTGDLTAQQGQISGDVIGTSSVGNPVLKGTGSISGDITGTSTVGAPILSGVGAIDGDIVGTSSVGTPTLKGTGSISGDVTGTSSVSNPVLSGRANIDGDAVGTSSVSNPVLSGDATIDGDAIGTSSATGNLSADAQISGDITGTSAASGDLDGIGSLSGDITGTSSATGILSAVGDGSIIGAITGTSSASADLSGLASVSGDTIGTSSATADLSAVGQLAGQVLATSTANGGISASADIAGDIVATSAATGYLTYKVIGRVIEIEHRYSKYSSAGSIQSSPTIIDSSGGNKITVEPTINANNITVI